MPKAKPSATLAHDNHARHLSCEGCRKRKMKCSRTSPCVACTLRGMSCEWKNCKPPSQGFTPASVNENYAEIVRLNKIVYQLQALIIERDGQPFNPDTVFPPTPPHQLDSPPFYDYEQPAHSYFRDGVLTYAAPFPGGSGGPFPPGHATWPNAPHPHPGYNLPPHPHPHSRLSSHEYSFPPPTPFQLPDAPSPWPTHSAASLHPPFPEQAYPSQSSGMVLPAPPPLASPAHSNSLVNPSTNSGLDHLSLTPPLLAVRPATVDVNHSLLASMAGTADLLPKLETDLALELPTTVSALMRFDVDKFDEAVREKGAQDAAAAGQEWNDLVNLPDEGL
ncbi:hypothetical protein JCM10207_002455 [Rhodosporidiobolus poonsookiae]